MPRLLIVKTSSLGDVIHNLPVLSDIAGYMPDIQVDWLVEAAFADVPALHPRVSRVIPVAVRRWRKHPWARQTWHEMADCKHVLQEKPYDLVLDTQGLLKSAWLSTWANGPRHGQDFGTAREPLAAFFYHERHHVARGQHAVTRNRQLAAQAFGYAMPETPPCYGIRTGELALPDEKYGRYVLGLHATSRDSKLWPRSHWLELARRLHTRGMNLLLPWGNAVERQRAEDISNEASNVQVLPPLRISELAAVLSGADAAVGVDTGLVHLAVALLVPTVAIYTSTDPLLTGVFPEHPARARNLGGVGQCPSVDEVMLALERLS